MILPRKEEQMKKAIYVCIVVIVLFFLFIPDDKETDTTYESGICTAEIFPLNENCPVAIKSEYLLFYYVNINNAGENGTITATYEIYNPTNETQQVQVVVPYITTLDNLSDDIAKGKLNIAVNEQPVSHEIYASYQSGGRDDISSILVSEEIEITNARQVVNQNYNPANFDLQEVGYFYTVTTSNTDYAVYVNNANQRISFDNFGLSVDEDKNLCYRFHAFGESSTYTIFSLDEPLDIYLKNRVTGEVVDSEAYSIEMQQITVEEYINQYEVAVFNEHCNIQMENINDYIAMIIDDRMYTPDKIFDNNWNSWGNSEMRVIFLTYTVDLAPGQTQTMRVQRPSSLYIAETFLEGNSYQETYMFSPAKHWAEFENVSVKIILPQFAPYLIESNSNFLESRSGTYTTDFEYLPNNDLIFTFFVQEESGTTAHDVDLRYMTAMFIYGFLPIVIFFAFIWIFICFVFKMPAENLETQFKKGSDHDDHHATN